MRPILMEDVLICPVCYALVLCPRNNTSFGFVHLRHHVKTGEIRSFSWDGWGSPIKIDVEESYDSGMSERQRKRHDERNVSRAREAGDQYRVPTGTYRRCPDCDDYNAVTMNGYLRRHRNKMTGAVCPRSKSLAPDIDLFKETYDNPDAGSAEGPEGVRSRDEGLVR